MYNLLRIAIFKNRNPYPFSKYDHMFWRSFLEIFLEKIKDEKKEKESVFIKIRDNGKGIDKGILHTLFHKFTTKSEIGTGLGLYISKNIVEAHGGKIWGMNNNIGYGENGAEFGFTLPLHNI